jgi:hypothetical protein
VSFLNQISSCMRVNTNCHVHESQIFNFMRLLLIEISELVNNIKQVTWRCEKKVNKNKVITILLSNTTSMKKINNSLLTNNYILS